eukprot:1137728-Pelagomonas_calceolata.AAC.3
MSYHGPQIVAILPLAHHRWTGTQHGAFAVRSTASRTGLQLANHVVSWALWQCCPWHIAGCWTVTQHGAFAVLSTISCFYLQLAMLLQRFEEQLTFAWRVCSAQHSITNKLAASQPCCIVGFVAMLPWHITGGQEHRRTASSALAVQCCHGRKGSGYGKGGDTYVPSGDCPRLPHCHCFHLHPVQSHPLALGGGVAGRAAGRQAAGALTPGRLAGLLATCRQVGILLQVLAYSTGGMPAAGPVASGRLAVLLATCADRQHGGGGMQAGKQLGLLYLADWRLPCCMQTGGRKDEHNMGMVGSGGRKERGPLAALEGSADLTVACRLV